MMDENVEKLSWHKRTNRKAYTMNFKLRQLEIVRKRNKWSDPCISDDLNYDEIILTEHLEKVGCKAPYQKTTKDLAICNSKDTLYGAKHDAREFQNSRAACTSASTITFTYEEVDLHFDDKFFSYIYFPGQIKEIVMVQAVDIHSAIGNVGGYIGLFLGNVTSYIN